MSECSVKLGGVNGGYHIHTLLPLSGRYTGKRLSFFVTAERYVRPFFQRKNRRQGSVVIGMGGFLTPIPNYTAYHYLFCYI